MGALAIFRTSTFRWERDGKHFRGRRSSRKFFRRCNIFSRVEFAKIVRDKNRDFASSSRNFSDVDLSVGAGWETFSRAKVKPEIFSAVQNLFPGGVRQNCAGQKSAFCSELSQFFGRRPFGGSGMEKIFAGEGQAGNFFGGAKFVPGWSSPKLCGTKIGILLRALAIFRTSTFRWERDGKNFRGRRSSRKFFRRCKICSRVEFAKI